MKILSGVFNWKFKKYDEMSENIFKCETENYFVSVFGEVVIESQSNSFNLITKYFEEYGNRITEYIKGLYILVIFDKKHNNLSIFQDRTTSPITLYYTYSEEELCFSTSLKKLLLLSNVSRKLNENVIEEFIVNGFIYGKQTLIDNVFKIQSSHCLFTDSSDVVQQLVNYRFTKFTKEEAYKSFKDVLDNAIIENSKGMEEINAPLSSGYDSSYIVDVLSKQTELPINAFSIGGKFGKNELPVVEKNVKQFKRTRLVSGLTDSSTLQNYPDIVWRLDGNVFEVGLFLQYELNKLVNENGKTVLICGECADQVMNQYYFSSERNKNDTVASDKYYDFAEYPYVFGSYLILKKSGILANSFNVKTKYPFLDDDFVSLCKPLADYNGKKKRIHVENCNKCLSKEIIKNISKIGGSTECHSLFNSDSEIKRFFRFVEKSFFYKRHKKLIDKHSYNKKIKPSFIIGVKTRIRNALYRVIRKDVDLSGQYFNEEMKLREYLNYTYLILFDELILSRKYDNEFMNPGINHKLSEYL